MSKMVLKNDKPLSAKDLVIGTPDERIERYKKKDRSQKEEIQQLKAQATRLNGELDFLRRLESIRVQARTASVRNVDEATRTALLLLRGGLKAIRSAALTYEVPGAANITVKNDYEFEKRNSSDLVRAAFNLARPTNKAEARHNSDGLIVSKFNNQRLDIGKRVTALLRLDSVSVEAAGSDGCFVVYFECSPVGKPWGTN